MKLDAKTLEELQRFHLTDLSVWCAPRWRPPPAEDPEWAAFQASWRARFLELGEPQGRISAETAVASAKGGRACDG